MGSANQNFLRFWIAGHVWGSAWQPWASRTLGYDGTVPNTGLTLERRHGSGIAALRLDDANPLTWQGFQSGHAGIVPGRTYRLLVRWRTDGVTGPASSGRPFGACVRFVGWPEPGETETEPLLIAHVAGDTPWHVAMAEFVAQGTALQSGEFLANPAVILENATSGAAYIDEIAVHEVLAGDALGPNVLRSPRLNSHLTFDPRRGAGLDAMLARAAERGIALRLVIGEKQDWILNRLAPDGLPDALGGHYHAPAGSAARWLHEAYWRHLRARFGAFDSLHSFELVNEDAPGMGDHFRAAAALAASAAADGHPHLASISTWATLAESAWLDGESAAISSTDFHAYVRTTGWLEPRDQLARDSARFFHEYDLDASAAGFGKPIVWGEQGIDSGTSTDDEDPRLASDDGGVWLHKMTWARSGAGGVYPLYWYTDNIERFALHRVFGAWRRFMDGVPLTSGRYEDALPVTSGPDLRAYGQKDEQDGRAHVFIDNARHTWDAVVAGRSIPPVSGSIAIDLRDAGARYLAAWIDTARPLPSSGRSSLMSLCSVGVIGSFTTRRVGSPTV
ncbi:MAG: hypothetical protein HC882_06960, partial [Acidobacteria bacterium]|nr:hypothetical protein [Acidobacteriota bacterium]